MDKPLYRSENVHQTFFDPNVSCEVNNSRSLATIYAKSVYKKLFWKFQKPCVAGNRIDQFHSFHKR